MDEKELQRIDAWLLAHREEFLEDLRAFVAIPSVSENGGGAYPFGKNCADAIRFFLEKAARSGFAAENLRNIAGRARLEGKTGARTIGIFAHGDVVPAIGDWQRDPFQMWVREGGWLVGRGVSDDKGPALGALYAMRYLKEHGIALQNHVELWLGSAEETGMKDLRTLRETETFPDISLVPDAGFPVSHGEKGIIHVSAVFDVGNSNLLSFTGGQAENMVAGSAEAVLSGVGAAQAGERMRPYAFIEVLESGENVRIVSTGISQHSARPEGARCAICQLAAALTDAGLVTGPAAGALRFIGASAKDFYGEALGLEREDESGRLTCILPLVRCTGRELRITFNIRYPVRSDAGELEAQMETRLSAAGFTDISYERDPGYLREIDDVVLRLTEISNEILHMDAKPYIMSGGSYARVVPGAVTYGFGNRKMDRERPFPPDQGRAHQANETISLEALSDGVKIYISALQELDKIIM